MWLLALSFAGHWRYPALAAERLAVGPMANAGQRLDQSQHTRCKLLPAGDVCQCHSNDCRALSRALAWQLGIQCWLALAGLPFAVSPVVYGLCLGQAYSWSGLSGAYAGVALAQLPFAYGYAVLIRHGFWTPGGCEITDSVRTLGYSHWQRTLRGRIAARG